MDFRLAASEEMLSLIFEGISEIKELRELRILVNGDPDYMLENDKKYSSQVGKIAEQRAGKWKKSLVKMIRKLEKLEFLELKIDKLEGSSQSDEWFLGLFQTLGECKKLRKVEFGVVIAGADLEVVGEIKKVLKSLKNIDVDMSSLVWWRSKVMKELMRTVTEMRNERSLRSDFMFSTVELKDF